MIIKPIAVPARVCIVTTLLAALFICTACTATPPPQKPAQEAKPSSSRLPTVQGKSAVVLEEGVPGGVIVNTLNLTARVTAIETANRKVTLLGPDGNTFNVKVGPEAVNFDQVQVGDLLDITVTEELVVYLDKYELSEPDGSGGIVALAPKGARPGGVIAETSQVTAIVTAIDSIGRKATLQFPDGRLKTIPVRDDIDLSQYKAGEKVVFQVTEMIAISVKKL